MKIFLLFDSGYEHNSLIDILGSNTYKSINTLKRQFENLVGYKPESLFSVCHPPKKQDKEMKKAKQKLIKLGYLENDSDNFLYVNEFLVAFSNWLIKEKGFERLSYKKVEYNNCY